MRSMTSIASIVASQPTGPLAWRYKQILTDGSVWTSDVVFTGEARHAVQGVVAGVLIHQPRAAIEEGTGRVIYAIDGLGRDTPEARKLFAA